MKSLIVTSLVFLTLSANAQTVPADSIQHGPDWPNWAYGEIGPYKLGDEVAPPCPENATPLECAYYGPPPEKGGPKYTLDESPQSFEISEADNDYGPGDWYPQDHPETPDIVAYGDKEREIRACSLCHYASGQGKMENGHVAGLPVNYFLQQLDAFANRERYSADLRKANPNEMGRIAALLTDEERKIAAEYFSSIEYKPHVKVVETDMVPQVQATMNGLLLPLEDEPEMELGQRIIEVAEHPERTHVLRDPRAGFIAYVPIGSVAKGAALATTGGGKTIQCGLCHGEGMRGLGDIPAIAGRTASYIMRQLWDVKQGTRISPVMDPIVAELSAEDMLNITAYIASLAP
ncbi:MAG: cytochrome C [Proteobacteria bacterium]|nr:cytochrome C [Pseudomonadota bacterium]